MNNKQWVDLKFKIENLEITINGIKQDIDNFEIDKDLVEELYIDALDSEGPVNIAGLQYNVSYALKKIDPTAYRVGLNDFEDSLEKDIDPAFNELEDTLEDLESELEDLESELEDLESELND